MRENIGSMRMAIDEVLPKTDVEEVEKATQQYLQGKMSLEDYERLLRNYLPDANALLRSLDNHQGFVARLAKRLKRSN
jgi:hypothetical protein